MIVLITSLTPRPTLSSPAISAQSAPVTMAMMIETMMFSQPGRKFAPAKTAAAKDAIRYWPSTPMLNRPILNPIATATAER